MPKPCAPINTPEKVRAAREYLGLDKTHLAEALRLGIHGRDTVRRLEAGTHNSIPGPTQLALEYLVSKGPKK